VAARKRRRSQDSGRAPMRSPGRPPVARREHRQLFWAAIARGGSSEDAGVDARGPAGPARLGVDRSDRRGELLVGDRTDTRRPVGGFVEPRP